MYSIAADGILVAHAIFVAFVVLGLAAIYLGRIFSWKWVTNFWFRVLHLASIAFVVLQSWVGGTCPLTVWEIRLRELGGEKGYDSSFVQHWLQTILYYEAPEWVFVTVYTAFFGLVAASWFIVPPKRDG